MTVLIKNLFIIVVTILTSNIIDRESPAKELLRIEESIYEESSMYIMNESSIYLAGFPTDICFQMYLLIERPL